VYSYPTPSPQQAFNEERRCLEAFATLVSQGRTGPRLQQVTARLVEDHPYTTLVVEWFDALVARHHNYAYPLWSGWVHDEAPDGDAAAEIIYTHLLETF
jgi:hypothetical protein